MWFTYIQYFQITLEWLEDLSTAKIILKESMIMKLLYHKSI